MRNIGRHLDGKVELARQEGDRNGTEIKSLEPCIEQMAGEV